MALRCFIAIDVPETIKKSIADMTFSLKQTGADVKWVAPENTHITLQFMGDTQESLIPAIKGDLDKILAHYTPFYIKITEISCFPSGKRPRVIWIEMEESQTLINLKKDIEDEMAKFGYQKEDRIFTPHITIGRIKSYKNISELLKRIDGAKTMRFPAFKANNITLMKSDLQPSGAKYYCLTEIPFGRRNKE